MTTYARNYDCWCKKCGISFKGFKRTQKFCCRKHRDSYNERRRQLERTLKDKQVK